MPLGPDDPTPNPEDLSPAALNRTMRRVLERLKALEAQAIIDTVNEHENRLDNHEERHTASDQRHAAAELRHQRELATTSLWREAITQKTDRICDGIGRLENALGTKP